MMDLDRNPTDPKFIQAAIAILSLIAASMGGAWAFTNAIAHDYVQVREFDREMSGLEQHLSRIEQHLGSVDEFVHGIRK